MSATVKLRNTNPLNYVDLPLIGREGPAFDADGKPTPAGTGCLMPGEVFEVPASIAGRAPSGTPSRGEPTDEDFVPASDDFDLGEGLLAQVGNYELVKPTAKKKAPAKNAAAKKGAVPAAGPTDTKES